MKTSYLALTALTSLALLGCGAGSLSTVDAEDTAGEDEGGVVHLTPEALAMSDIVVGTAGEARAPVLQATGHITYDEDRVSHVGPKTQGRVIEITAPLGAEVAAGEILAHLESSEIGGLRAELNETEALLGIARENYEREQRLEERGISSRSELLDAQAELRSQEARARGAEERLRVMGAGRDEEGGHFDIAAPFGGVVVERHVARGEVVGPDDQILTVADLSRLWVEFDVYEPDLARVALGQPVQVLTSAWPDRSFPGVIAYLSDILDPVRRTIRARVEVANPDRSLKPGMFATARIESEAGGRVAAIPRDAVQSIEGTDAVFMPGEEEGEFVPWPVQLGAELPGGLVEIVAGLSPGDPVVVAGAFTLKAELFKSEFGGHGHGD